MTPHPLTDGNVSTYSSPSVQLSIATYEQSVAHVELLESTEMTVPGIPGSRFEILTQVLHAAGRDIGVELGDR